MVNLADHFELEEGGQLTGAKVVRDVTLAQALGGASQDPCVGRFLEFRVVRNPASPDTSRVPLQMIPNPNLSLIPVSRERTFIFGRDGINVGGDALTLGEGPWCIRTKDSAMLNADY